MAELTKYQVNKIVSDSLICDSLFGIDPGISNGAISKSTEYKLESWNIEKLKNFDDMNDFFKYQSEICKLPLVILEMITTYPIDSKEIGRMYQLQKLKNHYAEIRACLKINSIPYIEVMPVVWQKYLKIHIKREDYSIRKHRYQDIAKDLYPQIKVTLKNCDSLLLIEFGKRKLYYDPLWIKANTKTKKIGQKMF